jgi:hypothetical protein
LSDKIELNIPPVEERTAKWMADEMPFTCDFGHSVMAPDGNRWVFCRKHVSHAIEGAGRCGVADRHERQAANERKREFMAEELRKMGHAMAYSEQTDPIPGEVHLARGLAPSGRAVPIRVDEDGYVMLRPTAEVEDSRVVECADERCDKRSHNIYTCYGCGNKIEAVCSWCKAERASESALLLGRTVDLIKRLLSGSLLTRKDADDIRQLVDRAASGPGG